MQRARGGKMSANQLNWLIDLAAFAVFFPIAAPQSTGIPVHEWLSVVFLGVFVVHVVVHWPWIVEVGRRFLKRVVGETRFNYVWDALFFLVMMAALVSGFAISEAVLPMAGIPLTIDPFWTILHDMTANLSLLMLAIHLGLHWQWIVNAFHRYVRHAATRKAE